VAVGVTVGRPVGVGGVGTVAVWLGVFRVFVEVGVLTPGVVAVGFGSPAALVAAAEAELFGLTGESSSSSSSLALLLELDRFSSPPLKMSMVMPPPIASISAATPTSVATGVFLAVVCSGWPPHAAEVMSCAGLPEPVLPEPVLPELVLPELVLPELGGTIA